jgi:dolichol kinase
MSSSDGIQTEKIEQALGIGFIVGASFLILNAAFGKSAKKAGGRVAKVFIELQRKSFHMIGGCLLGSAYHWGIKSGVISSAYISADAPQPKEGEPRPFDGGAAYISLCFIVWIIEFARLQIPVVRNWYLTTFKGLVREKEFNTAAGIAYFIPGILAAMLASPSNTAILGILFLSIGDAASSLGTAAGYIPVGSSKRKVEGSIGCFVICSLLGIFVGLTPEVALVTSGLVTFGEVLAEVIGLDDNLVIPMLGVLGVRIAQAPQYHMMAGVMGVGLGIGVLLGAVVSLTTPAETPVKKAE